MPRLNSRGLAGGSKVGSLDRRHAALGSSNNLGEKRAKASAKQYEMGSSEDLSRVRAELARLQTLDGSGLREEWRRLCRAEPPRLSRDLLMRALAYRIQETALGGLPKFALRRLGGLAGAADNEASAAASVEDRLKPGARLVREWHGRVYSVIVREQGFELDGRFYGSLTQIAREITGAKWSGPRFFGLVDRRVAGRQDVSDDPVKSTDDGDRWRTRAKAGGDRDD